MAVLEHSHGCHSKEKADNLDDHFSRQVKHRKFAIKEFAPIAGKFLKFYELKYMPRLLGDNPMMESYCNRFCCIWNCDLKYILVVIYLYGQQ